MSLQGVEQLSLLSFLDMDDNDITDVEELQYVQGLSMLRQLSLRKNPIDSTQHPIAPSPFHKATSVQETNRLLLLYLVPHLRVLNGLPVSVEEKVAAMNAFNPPQDVTQSLQHAREVQRTVK